MDSELFDKNALLILWPNDGIIRVKITPNADGTIDKECYPFNVNWDYYWREIAYAQRTGGNQDLIRDMNKCLIEVNVLCFFREGAFGIIQNGFNISSEYWLNNSYYFSRCEYAKDYLDGKIEFGYGMKRNSFVFQIA